MSPKPEPEPKPESGSRSAVLIIDDSEIDREAMASVLSGAGLVVHVLPSPIGATRLARQLGVRAVVIDQNLPAMDGNKLAQLFRGNPVMRNIRVVLVSGNDDERMTEIAREARADAFVSKGRMHTELARTVLRLLQ
jgi:two-component system, chemotaxis family, response regulator WspR